MNADQLLTTRRGGVWATTKFNEELVNHNVDLVSIGVSNFRGIYSTSLTLMKIMDNIRNICKLKNEMVILSHTKNNVKSRFIMNGTWVSDGVGATTRQANAAAINNAMIFLIQKKGFQVMAAEHILPQAIMKVSEVMLLSDPRSQMKLNNQNFEAVRQNAGRYLHEFLMNPRLLKIEFNVGALSRALKEDIHNSANVCRLNHKSEGPLICCWKINSTYHNLFDRPHASLAARVPPLERILERKNKKKKNKLPPGAASWGYLGKPAGPKNVFASAEEVATAQKTFATGKDKAAKRLAKQEKKAARRERAKERRSMRALKSMAANTPSNAPNEQDVPVCDKMNPFINVSYKKFFQGFSFLSIGWKERPSFVLEKSAICSGFQCNFVIDPDGLADNLTVRLFMNKIRRGNSKEMWLSTGRGKTFSDAKEDCARVTVNFLRRKGIGKFNNAKWNKFIQQFHHPDHVWSFSWDDLGGKFLLSSPHERVSEDNIGHKMLQQIGWRPNTGIGKHRQGILSPIEIWIGHSGFTGLGYKVEKEAEEDSIFSHISFEKVLVRFANDLDAWKLQFVDMLSASDARKIMSLSSHFKLKSLFYEKRRLVLIWKPIFQAMGKLTERRTLQEYDKEISDEESLHPQVRRYFEIEKGHDEKIGTVISGFPGSGDIDDEEAVCNQAAGEDFDENIDGEVIPNDDGYFNEDTNKNSHLQDDLDGDDLDGDDYDGEAYDGYNDDDDLDGVQWNESENDSNEDSDNCGDPIVSLSNFNCTDLPGASNDGPGPSNVPREHIERESYQYIDTQPITSNDRPSQRQINQQSQSYVQKPPSTPNSRQNNMRQPQNLMDPPAQQNQAYGQNRSFHGPPLPPAMTNHEYQRPPPQLNNHQTNSPETQNMIAPPIQQNQTFGPPLPPAMNITGYQHQRPQSFHNQTYYRPPQFPPHQRPFGNPQFAPNSYHPLPHMYQQGGSGGFHPQHYTPHGPRPPFYNQ